MQASTVILKAVIELDREEPTTDTAHKKLPALDVPPHLQKSLIKLYVHVCINHALQEEAGTYMRLRIIKKS